MIMSRTPLRVSFVGGGTDLPTFYEAHEYGSVISTSINRYIYVCVNNRFDGMIRLAYSKNELASSIEEIQNERVRASLRRLDILHGVEVFYISDIPKQMGLGGSSSFTVGLLHALYRYKGENVFPERLAREACQLEINDLNNPIGKQDQYAAAFGGLNYIKFAANGSVSLHPILIDESLVRSIFNNLLFLYLGQSHDASHILTDVAQKIKKNGSIFLEMRNITDNLYQSLLDGKIDEFKLALKENWELKKKTSNKITSNHIEELYNSAIAAGAEAGKVLGAGGGGFLMMYVPVEKQDYFCKKMGKINIHRFEIDHSGTQIIQID